MMQTHFADGAGIKIGYVGCGQTCLWTRKPAIPYRTRVRLAEMRGLEPLNEPKRRRSGFFKVCMLQFENDCWAALGIRQTLQYPRIKGGQTNW